MAAGLICIYTQRPNNAKTELRRKLCSVNFAEGKFCVDRKSSFSAESSRFIPFLSGKMDILQFRFELDKSVVRIHSIMHCDVKELYYKFLNIIP